MHISIVIAAYNVSPWLTDAIKSVQRQSFTDWSLVVVDDGSDDGTSAIVEAYRDPRIRLIRQANAGVSVARNRGLAASTGDAILFLDGDDWLSADALWLLSDALMNAPCAVAACCGYARVETDGSRRTVAAPSSDGLLERLLVSNQFANGGHILIRRGAIDAAGGFNPCLSFGEDWDYWTRIALLGEFVTVKSEHPLLFVRDRIGGTCITAPLQPGRFAPSMNAVFGNPEIALRIGQLKLAALRQRAEAENAWVIGRELIKHRRAREGRGWLVRSLWTVPSLRRVALLGWSWLGRHPFKPYMLRQNTTADRGWMRAFAAKRAKKFATYRQCD